jgi:AraC-like DNA-binding protein
LLRALHLRLFGESLQRPVGPLDIQRLDNHIQDNLARRITVAELAQVVCLSPSHFHAQFKDCVGLTPHQYLLKTRLDRAARLLRETPLPLVRIAEECGFSSQSALTTATRRYLGLTPADCASQTADRPVCGLFSYQTHIPAPFWCAFITSVFRRPAFVVFCKTSVVLRKNDALCCPYIPSPDLAHCLVLHQQPGRGLDL